MLTLEKKGDFILIQNDTPYLNVRYITNFNISINTEDSNTVLREFRWSFDNKTYSSWTPLDPNALRSIKNIKDELWVQIRITNTYDKPVYVDEKSFELILDTIKHNPDIGLLPPNLICMETGNWAGISKIPNLCFNPYDVNPAICLFEELSYGVNKMFGHDVDYFRAIADERGRDVIIKEHTIYNVEDPVCIKILVPNNEFPSNELQHNPFGVSFEVPFEVEIDKNIWKEYFPEGSGPQKRDVIYFPLTNRIYEVMSTHMVRGFMEKETHWKISLVKYSPKVNRKEPQSLKDAVDALTNNMQKEFGVERKEAELKETKPQQYTPDTTDNKRDPIRKWVHKNISIQSTPIKNYGTIISEQHYDITALATNGQIPIVKYIPTVNIKNDISYCAWISEQRPMGFNPIDKVERLAALGDNIIVDISKQRSWGVGDYLKIHKGTKLVVYGVITSITPRAGMFRYSLKTNSEIIADLNTKNSAWTGLNGWSVEKILPTNLINGLDETTNTGMRLDIIAGKFIRAILNDTTHIAILEDSLVVGEWYGIHINMSKLYNQIEFNVWQRKWVEDILSSPQTTDLFNIYNISKNNISISDMVLDKNFELLSSNSKITNIRLFDNIAEIEKQPRILNQNIVKDAQRAIIIDNALPKYFLPHITS